MLRAEVTSASLIQMTCSLGKHILSCSRFVGVKPFFRLIKRFAKNAGFGGFPLDDKTF